MTANQQEMFHLRNIVALSVMGVMEKWSEGGTSVPSAQITTCVKAARLRESMQSTILSFMTPQRTQVSDFHSPGPQDLMDLKGSVDFLAPKGNMDLLDPMDQ